MHTLVLLLSAWVLFSLGVPRGGGIAKSLLMGAIVGAFFAMLIR